MSSLTARRYTFTIAINKLILSYTVVFYEIKCLNQQVACLCLLNCYIAFYYTRMLFNPEHSSETTTVSQFGGRIPGNGNIIPGRLYKIIHPHSELCTHVRYTYVCIKNTCTISFTYIASGVGSATKGTMSYV